MKILHIIDTLTMGGAENLLIVLAGEQVAKGHIVTVAPLVCPAHTTVRDKMERKGIIVLPLSQKGTVYNPLFSIKIARVLRKYDIIHVHLFPALYWAGLAKAFTFSKKPLVYTEHSTKNKRRGNKILHFTDKIIYKYCYDRIVACSQKAFDSFRKAYPTVGQITYVNNGVDTKEYIKAEPYTKSELLGIPEDCFVVTMVEWFMSIKRQDTVVEAISLLPCNYHAVFVGGEEKDEGLIRVKKLAKEKGVSERVHFLYLRKDVPRILKTSDINIMASDYEGLSLSSVEGMAAGKPFIATDVDGLREVVGGAGILYKNRDPEELSKIILLLSENQALYKEIAEKCLNRSKEYDACEMNEGYIRQYNTILK